MRKCFKMRKNFLYKLFSILFLITFSVAANAQYGSINAILTKLEDRKGINQPVKKLEISGKKFLLIEDFADHTERSFIIISGKNLTYVEIFDDKADGKSVSNVFSGDIVQSKNNIVSIRANLLEGKKIAIPITKTFFATTQDGIIYLIDINSRKRWIDEISLHNKNRIK